MEPDLSKEILILELNMESPFIPHIRMDGKKAIIEGTEEQFKALWEMIGEQYDFQTEFDGEEEA
jgi:restriction endonuclease